MGQQGHRLSTPAQKLEWLRQHPELWDRPGFEVKRAMIAAGLCSENTHVRDLKLPRLLQEIGRISVGERPSELRQRKRRCLQQPDAATAMAQRSWELASR
jgi:hypothetical protein